VWLWYIQAMTKEKLTKADNLDEVKKTALNLFDENQILQDQIKSLQDKLFGRKTEKSFRDDDQLSLFDIPEP
jgi:transposase